MAAISRGERGPHVFAGIICPGQRCTGLNTSHHDHAQVFMSSDRRLRRCISLLPLCPCMCTTESVRLIVSHCIGCGRRDQRRRYSVDRAHQSLLSAPQLSALSRGRRRCHRTIRSGHGPSHHHPYQAGQRATLPRLGSIGKATGTASFSSPPWTVDSSRWI